MAILMSLDIFWYGIVLQKVVDGCRMAGDKVNPRLGSILLCLFSKSPKSGTANLFANGCKYN